MKRGRPVKRAAEWSLRPRKLDNHFDRGTAQLEEQNKIIVMPIADLTVDQLNL
jgi:hypothetical protein